MCEKKTNEQLKGGEDVIRESVVVSNKATVVDHNIDTNHDPDQVTIRGVHYNRINSLHGPNVL